MKFLLAALVLLPGIAFAQTVVDPNGYAIVCDATSCATNLPTEQGNSILGTVSKGYVLSRIDLPTGEHVDIPSGDELVSDPEMTLLIGTVDATP